jgi:hypothetical protein
MKIALSSIFILFSLILNAQNFEFQLYHCESSLLIQINNDSLYYENKTFDAPEYKTSITKKDLALLNRKLHAIFQKKGNETWYNHCIDDGVNLKFMITKNGISKKVFVGNYFDTRLNEIALIINKYLKEVTHRFKSKYGTINSKTSIPYGIINKNQIKGAIKQQANCPNAPKEYREYLLNEWCDLPK